jgi:tetratricopeptide (TPR) repeat protein
MVVAAVVGGAFLFAGIQAWARGEGGLAWVGAGLAVAGAGAVLGALLIIGLKIEATAYRFYNAMLDFNEQLHMFERSIQTISENSQISDTAKSIANRTKERDTLRRAIREDILLSDWEAAYTLISDMEERFGYVEEAQVLRREVDQSRQMSIEEKIVKALAHLNQLMDQHEWERASLEANRLIRLFPHHPEVQYLPELMKTRRQDHKRSLLQKWNELVARHDVEASITVLRELDPYLTPSEAKALSETVRGVFKEKLARLGVKFSLAVTESRWKDALEIGLEIREEFPNSRMAEEVSTHVDALRQRAGMTADVNVTQQSRAATT